MSAGPKRVYAARMVGLPVFDPRGDEVARVHDLVVQVGSTGRQPRVVGMVAAVLGRRRIFIPMTRVTNIEGGQVHTTGLLNMRRFEQRAAETLVIAQMLDREVVIRDSGIKATIYDVAMDLTRSREWMLSKVAVQEPGRRFGRRGQTHIVDWDDVEGLATHEERQAATSLVAQIREMKPADAASTLHDLPIERRDAVIAALSVERLADIIEEFSPEIQVSILNALPPERAADVLEEMSADDAADLINDLPPEKAEELLALMEREEAEGVKRLLSYSDETAGGMMTPEPVILPPDATVAEALAHVRKEELPTSLAAQVYVCRPPLETPTGRLIGLAHIQRLLREPPSSLVAGILDKTTTAVRADATIEEVAGHVAFYNLTAAPVVDDEGRLLGAVTVDDLLDHMLPDGWRDQQYRTTGG